MSSRPRIRLRRDPLWIKDGRIVKNSVPPRGGKQAPTWMTRSADSKFTKRRLSILICDLLILVQPCPDIAGHVPPATRTRQNPRGRGANPKLRLVRQGIMALTWGLAPAAGYAFWLLQGERDRDADEVEGFALGAGRLGEHGHGGASSGEADLVAGQGGQVL